ncbi:glycine zipper 2TM domain-containing protein [Caballeronia sp. LP006]|jgi:outer membrane lipoprotein SlyB|uniref:glycine zipper 2TM domain-containing protein n=1 Tax=unclassified Caballeronia TaxID=2646786 RepID=UPI001FD4CD1B|nr:MULTISPECIES: glycine zipper 2TM domain-containing protein [unclassified Caballeronia]MDR5772551.1 glycine zipper 2TM domain-containing protein [Caballeronia sp. LZ002]MDR5804022.1 glycine zipper 2TM domain-containing protein [Caballeronia sp. LZ001]MDR5832144.1 glycine zipper 2TM domain-containing protein [Caballeronia sp. LP006]MDR5847985.1 glycine zipper 2TM domain-containing protein [Caballeronia sp. LZ003]
MKTISRIALAVALVGSVALTGCAYNSSSPDVYTASQAQREETVRMATVESVRGVKISSNNGQPTGLGTIGGGALGGVAAASVIGGGNGSIIAGIIGGLAGAVAGNAVENNVAMKNGLEITVRLDNGDMRAITQTSNGEVFQAGERVRLLSSGGVTRVTH